MASKASEWAEACAAALDSRRDGSRPIECRPTFRDKFGHLVADLAWERRNNTERAQPLLRARHRDLEDDDAVKYARWILDTFGDSGAA